MAIINNLPMGGGSEIGDELLIPFRVELVEGKDLLSGSTDYINLYIYDSSSSSNSQYVQQFINYNSINPRPMWQFLTFTRSHLESDGSNSIKIKVTATGNIILGYSNTAYIGGNLSSSSTSVGQNTGSYNIGTGAEISKGTVFFVEAVRNGNNTTINTTDESGNVLATKTLSNLTVSMGLWWISGYYFV